MILGSLAFFIYGMKIMSEGIQRAAGNQLRNILRGMTKNRYLGVLTGFLTTALVQSSSATTVMTVSFVNAGLISLVESAGVMMGANIGTTVTGWLISILGFKVKLSAISIPLFAIGIPMLFRSKGKIRYWGEFIIGFAILFLGLSYLKDAVPDLKNNTQFLEFVQGFTQWGVFSRILLVLVGALVTIIIQSSSAAMAITLTMCANGWLPLEVAAAMILGENIGTTITAELASLVANVHAKRSARIHSLFNVIGVVWMVILLPVLFPPLIRFIEFLGQTFGFEFVDPENNPVHMPIALSAFHTAFNFTNVILLIGFVPWLVKASIRTVKSKGAEDEELHLQYITAGLMETAEMSITEANKEIESFTKVVDKMFQQVRQLLFDEDVKDEKLLKKIAKREDATDTMEVEIADFLSKVSEAQISAESSHRVQSMLSMINDLERMGDVMFQMSKTYERIKETNIKTPEVVKAELAEMMDKVSQFISLTRTNIGNGRIAIDMDEVIKIEDEINSMRDSIRKKHYKRLESKKYKAQEGIQYLDLINSSEKLGDHLVNVNEAIAGIK